MFAICWFNQINQVSIHMSSRVLGWLSLPVVHRSSSVLRLTVGWEEDALSLPGSSSCFVQVIRHWCRCCVVLTQAFNVYNGLRHFLAKNGPTPNFASTSSRLRLISTAAEYFHFLCLPKLAKYRPLLFCLIAATVKFIMLLQDSILFQIWKTCVDRCPMKSVGRQKCVNVLAKCWIPSVAQAVFSVVSRYGLVVQR